MDLALVEGDMRKVFFISDLHFSHKWAAEFRGFDKSEWHDINLISQWNNIVSSEDLVYILGDLTMHDAKSLRLLDQLYGEKRVVMGNHDSDKGWLTEAQKYITRLYGCHRYEERGLPAVKLTHMPIHPIEFEYNYNEISYNIHGHMHGFNVPNDPRYINVTIESLDFKPRTLRELLNAKKED